MSFTSPWNHQLIESVLENFSHYATSDNNVLHSFWKVLKGNYTIFIKHLLNAFTSSDYRWVWEIYNSYVVLSYSYLTINGLLNIISWQIFIIFKEQTLSYFGIQWVIHVVTINYTISSLLNFFFYFQIKYN